MFFYVLFSLAFFISCATGGANPAPDPAPIAKPIEKPDPFRVPVFGAPDVVGTQMPFTIWLCGEPWSPGLQVKASSHILGTMAHHRETGCSYLIVPGLNTPGVRLLEAGLHERQILIFDKAMLTPK